MALPTVPAAMVLASVIAPELEIVASPDALSFVMIVACVSSPVLEPESVSPESAIALPLAPLKIARCPSVEEDGPVMSPVPAGVVGSYCALVAL